ncbi:MAG: sigma-70 family RNA polymerase sigma factor [Bacteroidia bacterium]|nr:sigma-70 family RNA polymerase sigma factor [Bacteroidia bacterium]
MSKGNRNIDFASDEQLMGELNNGNKFAFEQLYDRYFNKLVFFANGHIKDQIKSEDIVQEVFVKIIENPQLFNTNYTFSTWIYTMVLNRCKNTYRDQMNRQQLLQNQRASSITEMHSKRDYELLNQEISNCLIHMSEKDKRIYELRFQEEMSLTEISKLTELPVGTVKSSLHYIIKKLAQKLKPFTNHE